MIWIGCLGHPARWVVHHQDVWAGVGPGVLGLAGSTAQAGSPVSGRILQRRASSRRARAPSIARRARGARIGRCSRGVPGPSGRVLDWFSVIYTTVSGCPLAWWWWCLAALVGAGLGRQGAVQETAAIEVSCRRNRPRQVVVIWTGLDGPRLH